MLNTTSGLVASKSIFNSKISPIRGLDDNHSIINKTNIVYKVSIIGKANMGTFYPKIAKFKELIQSKKSRARFFTFRTRLVFAKLK